MHNVFLNNLYYQKNVMPFILEIRVPGCLYNCMNVMFIIKVYYGNMVLPWKTSLYHGTITHAKCKHKTA